MITAGPRIIMGLRECSQQCSAGHFSGLHLDPRRRFSFLPLIDLGSISTVQNPFAFLMRRKPPSPFKAFKETMFAKSKSLRGKRLTTNLPDTSPLTTFRSTYLTLPKKDALQTIGGTLAPFSAVYLKKLLSFQESELCSRTHFAHKRHCVTLREFPVQV